MKPEIKYALYIDLEGTGRWRDVSNAEERAKVQKHCREYYVGQCEKHNPIGDGTSRGDDFLIWFDSSWDVVNAALDILKNAKKELVMTNSRRDIMPICPRITAFAADICHDREYQVAYQVASSEQVDNILPKERDIAKVGFLVIDERLYKFMPYKDKNKFVSHSTVKGKRGDKISTYITKKEYKFPITKTQKKEQAYVESLASLLITNLVSRNTITDDLLSEIIKNKKAHIDGDWLIQKVMESFRAFLESSVAVGGDNENSDVWHFKLSLWVKSGKDKIGILNLAYPPKVKSRTYDEGLVVKVGENLVGKCWKKNKTIIIPYLDQDKRKIYVPLHDGRSEAVCSMSAFPVTNSKNVVLGVVSVDTNICGFYETKRYNEDFHTMCASSFIKNLALGLTVRGLGVKKGIGNKS